MKRISLLWKASPRRLLVAISTMAVASAVVVGSGANFNSTSASADNTFTAGTLSHSNSKNNQAILSASEIKPGYSDSGVADIVNTGSLGGTFTLTKSNLSDAPSSPALSGKLDLVVEDLGDCTPSCTATPVEKYNGTIGAMGAVALGTFAANEEHRYRFTVSFPDGTPAEDNPYQGASTTVRFNWEASS